MTADTTSEIERLFELALGHQRSERSAVLAAACSDAAVLREVESLLAADDQAGDFLEARLPPAYGPGERIGPYRLVRKLGEGETSSVYLAERDDDEYRQQVAIKLIRPGMDSRQILQRFYRERQILASLGHPNIARLLDGGSTLLGQPYFVMEYVDGEPLDAHCNRAGLNLAQRLELFRRVCQAVHYAHCNLVVHRDLKPGNILVAADGTPKLLDFGIAKLLDPDRAGIRAERTVTAARLMTPNYASPEQVQGKPVSTASDVYSLGVVLYKLLTGRRPYELTSHSLHDIERVVCDSVPPPPSQVLRARRERLPRDLDNIVLMAMRKEPERRYASAQELAEDVLRCLQHRPVVARRDTLGYRAASFVRRNPGAAAAAATILLLIIAGAVATTWQWREAVAERRRADEQRQIAERTLKFVVDLFDVHGSPRDRPAGQLLVRGANDLGKSEDPPQVRARLRHTLGIVFRNYGDYQNAAAQFEDAVAIRRVLPDAALELADSQYALGSIDSDNGRIRSAESRLRAALALRSSLRGPDDPSVAEVLEALAGNSGYNVSLQEAEQDQLRAIDIRRKQFGDNAPEMAHGIAGLAAIYSRAGRYDNAESLFGEAMSLKGYAPDGHDCKKGDQELFYELGVLRLREGYFEDAEHKVDLALDCLEHEVDHDHTTAADWRTARVLIWRAQGYFSRAARQGYASLEERTALHSLESPAIDNALHHLAQALYENGDLAAAANHVTEALTRREKLYGHVHASVAASEVVRGQIQLANGEPIPAEATYRDALAILPRTLGSEHPDVGVALRGLAEALIAQNRDAEARPLAERALELQRRKLRPGHPEIAATLAVLATLADRAAPGSGESLFRKALEIARGALRKEHPHIMRLESQLGASLALQPRDGEGALLLRSAADQLSKELGDAHFETRRARQRCASASVPCPVESPAARSRRE